MNRLVAVLSTLLVLQSYQSQKLSRCADYAGCDRKLTQVYTNHYHDEFLSHPTEPNLDSICGFYQMWLLCLKSLAAECHDDEMFVMNQTLTRRRRVAHICLINRRELINTLPCLQTQGPKNNMLLRACQDLRDLQLDAHIYSRCRVMNNCINCEDALIRSACGSIAADFWLTLTLESKSHKCVYEPSTEYKGFRYTLSCPPEFPVVVKECFRTYDQFRPAMSPNLPVVIKGSQTGYVQFCSSYQQYQQCVAPVMSQCPEGLDYLYRVMAEWRHSLSVAQYLCDEAFYAYSKSLPCLQAASTPHSPSWCTHLYTSELSRVQAYTSKCRGDTKQQLEWRGHMIDCYETYVVQRCGGNTSNVITPLLRLQYSMDYLPPCLTERSDLCHLQAAVSLTYQSKINIIVIVISLLYVLIFVCQ